VAKCVYCGKEAYFYSYHEPCRLEYQRKLDAGEVTIASEKTGATPQPSGASQELPRPQSTPAGIIWLNLFGTIAMGVGLYFLLISPNVEPERVAYSVTGPALEVVNLHKMYIGQTLTIVGAVFLAAAWRPR
jgi:hypothetical protein